MSEEFLTKEEIEQIEDIKTVTVEVPEWNGKKVNIRGMSGTERDEYDNILAKHTTGTPPNHTFDMKGARAEVLSLCLVDSLGARMFHDSHDIEVLSAKSGAVISRLYDIAMDKSSKLLYPQYFLVIYISHQSMSVDVFQGFLNVSSS